MCFAMVLEMCGYAQNLGNKKASEMEDTPSCSSQKL